MRAQHGLAAAMLVVATTAHAEGQWLTVRARIASETRVEAWGGGRSVGLGLMTPAGADNARRAWSAELAYAFVDRVFEARAAHVWQLTKPQFATASATLGASGFLVPGSSNGGIGPTAGLSLSLGGPRFSVDLGLQTGIDLFATGTSPRLPQRATIGVTGRILNFTLSAMARAGADIVPNHAFVGRADFVLCIGWLFAMR